MSPDAPTDSLHAQLDALAGWIREPTTHAPPPGVEPRRLDLYRELFFNNIAGLLGGNFPVRRPIHGEKRWQGLVPAFYHEHGGSTPQFYEMAAALMTYREQRATQIAKTTQSH